MSKPRPTSVDDLSLDERRGLVAELLVRVSALEDENAALEDEAARLKGLKGRPKLKPSGMEKATGGTKATTGRKKTKRKLCRRSPEAREEHKLSVRAPLGSRFKGYDDFVVQDLRIEGRVFRSRRERWVTPEGRLIVAPLPPGLRGHFGPELVRFILLQYHQGQVTADRITILLNDLGLVISKRQVLRLPRGDVAAFADEANAALRAGLTSASWITVDDTGARHRGRNGVTTQIGDDRFTRELIWWFDRDLKIDQDNPCPKRAAQLRARFKRIFSKKHP